jgi:hypothetical protein
LISVEALLNLGSFSRVLRATAGHRVLSRDKGKREIGVIAHRQSF